MFSKGFLQEGHLFQRPSGASFLCSVAVLIPAFSRLNQLMQILLWDANLEKLVGICKNRCVLVCSRNINKKWASSFYRTATTQYPCCVPTLGDSWGAGRKRLTHGTKVKKIMIKSITLAKNAVQLTRQYSDDAFYLHFEQCDG